MQEQFKGLSPDGILADAWQTAVQSFLLRYGTGLVSSPPCGADGAP